MAYCITLRGAVARSPITTFRTCVREYGLRVPAPPSNCGASVLEIDGCVQGELPTGEGSPSGGNFVGTVEKSSAARECGAPVYCSEAARTRL